MHRLANSVLFMSVDQRRHPEGQTLEIGWAAGGLVSSGHAGQGYSCHSGGMDWDSVLLSQRTCVLCAGISRQVADGNLCDLTGSN